MKYTLHNTTATLALLSLCTLHSTLCTVKAQGTAFSYEGQLLNSGSPVNGYCDFTFALFNDSLGSNGQDGRTLTNTDVGVTNGLFTVTLDFGAVFTGNPTWLAIAVRTNGGASFTALTPLQPLLPTPYAIFANTASNVSGTVSAAQLSGAVPNASLSGTYGNAVTFLDPSNTIAGSFTGNGAGLSNLNASQLTSGTVPLAQLPAAVVTNNEPTLSFSNLTLTGKLILPANAPAIYSSGLAFVHEDAGENFFAGLSSGNLTLSGQQNTGVGFQALENLTTGYYNTAIGTSALQGNTTGYFNTASGFEALYVNSVGSYNTASGYEALLHNTSGSNNTALGFQAIFFNQTGQNNTAVGYNALELNMTAWYNTAIGQQALGGVETGSNNIGVGYQAGLNLGISSSSNIDIGNLGLSSDTNLIRIGSGQTTAYIVGVITGNGGGLTNVAVSNLVGTLALAQLPAGAVTNNETGVTFSNLTLAGGLYLPQILPDTIYTGTPASGFRLFRYDGSDNIFVGYDAGSLTAANGPNAAFGGYALNSITTGAYNTAIGEAALNYNTTGSQNTALGSQALYNNVGLSSYNTAIGYQGLYGNTNGQYNIALGYQAGYNPTSGSSNIDIGNGGSSADNNIIRIGSGQTTAYIAGVITGNGAGLSNLNVSFAQLPATVVTNTETGVTLSGTFSGNGAGLSNLNISLAQLPAATVTNNETNVTLGSLTLDPSNTLPPASALTLLNGALTLPFPATIYSGTNTLLSDSGSLYLGIQAGYSDPANPLNPNYNNNAPDLYNVGLGDNALYGNSTGYNNTAIGYNALPFITGGASNIAVGYQAGYSYTSNETGNIDIGNAGVTAENYTIRIGNYQASAYMAGIYGTPLLSNSLSVFVDSSGHLSAGSGSGGGSGVSSLTSSTSDITVSPPSSTGAVTLGVNQSPTFTGTVSANAFSGDGSALTSLNGANLTTGSVGINQLANSSITINAGTGISVTPSSTVPLGGSVTINATGSGQAVQSLNTLQGAVTLAAGANVTITTSGNTLTIASSAGSGGGGGCSSPATPPTSGYPILNMVWIVPGTFVMGTPTSDPNYHSDETQHVVTLTQGFWIGQHLVTQGEYLDVIGDNPSFFTGDLSRPVESVSWFDAGTFCTTLTANEQSAGRLPSGWVYRLPTESEWEYCCRALTTTYFYWGNDPNGTLIGNYAWYSGNSGNTTQPVGQKLPNAWGLVDMAGNIFEWCQDWFGAYPTGPVTDPQGPAEGSGRVFRGGGWGSNGGDCRSAVRGNGGPAHGGNNAGFRVVLAPGQ